MLAALIRLPIRKLSLLLLPLSLSAGGAAQAVSIDWVPIGNAGNAPDETGYGSVANAYRIGKYEVSNGQYSEFLNAIAASDPNRLYTASMAFASQGGIERSGDAGSYRYAARPGMASKPVNYVSFFDAARFANWLENGQPAGDQGPLTTEDGAYTFLDGALTGGRHPDASIFLPSEDEWYKAAYHDAGQDRYWQNPTRSDLPPICGDPPGGANAANCRFELKRLTDVGAYANSPSAYGTSDQGGNVFEWNEAEIDGFRGLRGGSWIDPPGTNYLESSYRSVGGNPEQGTVSIGFRMASIIPEPGTGVLMGLGLAGLGLRSRRSR